MYSQSIDKLKSVLSAMQSMSAKREKLEKHLRGQLLAEIQRLKGGSVGGGSNGIKKTPADLLVKVATLEADLIKVCMYIVGIPTVFSLECNIICSYIYQLMCNVMVPETRVHVNCTSPPFQWEQRCLELVAEKQMALEAAVIPRDSRMEQLERTVSEQTVTIQELCHQRSSYISQLTDTNKKLAELETKVSSLRQTVTEKDAVIQALQHSFLDPEDLSQDEYTFMGSPVLHHSPVAAKKLGFPLTGAQMDIDGTVSLPGDITSSYPIFPHSPPTRKRGLPNGAYAARGHMSENLSPVRRYSDKGVAVGPRSLSPVKRTAPPPMYMMKDPPAYGSGGNGSPSPHYNKLNYPLPVSNSAPNSPNNRTGLRRGRTSHPNMHFLQVPSSKSPPPSSPWKPPFENGKSNSGPAEMRRNHSKPPLSPNPAADRAVKSKTPPPNHKLVSFSSSTTYNLSQKQRHHSVDDVVKDRSTSLAIKKGTPNSMELFNSLLGDNAPPQSQSEYKQAMHTGGVRERGVLRQGHQHSKSSPSSERRNCYTIVN